MTLLNEEYNKMIWNKVCMNITEEEFPLFSNMN